MSFFHFRPAPPYSQSLPGRLPQLRPGDDGFCQRCANEGHDRTQCPDGNHRDLVSGGPCPHPRRRGAATTVRPSDSISQVGNDWSFSSVLGHQAPHIDQNQPRLMTWEDARRELPTLSQAEAQRLADRYNTALRARLRTEMEQRLRNEGVDPTSILDPAPPPANPAAPLGLNPPAPNPAMPGPPGPAVVVPFQNAAAPAAQRLTHEVLVGHITMTQAHANFAVVHRQTYNVQEIQNGLTAAAAGNFVSLSYMAFRFNIASNVNWTLRVRVIQSANRPNAPADLNAFNAIGGTLFERTNDDPVGALVNMPFVPAIDLAVPLQVVAVLTVVSGQAAAGAPALGQVQILTGANVA